MSPAMGYDRKIVNNFDLLKRKLSGEFLPWGPVRGHPNFAFYLWLWPDEEGGVAPLPSKSREEL